MSVFRINKNKNYTVISNIHLRDMNLSLKAKGLLSVMLSLPTNWDYSIAGLVAISKENESCINSTLKELKTYGYLVVTKLMPNETKTGRIEYVYDIYEQPIQASKKQALENLGLEHQWLENQGQLNTNELNKEYKEKIIEKKFKKPTIEEIALYCRERNNQVDPESFFDFYESKGWKVGKEPMKDWRACVRTWEKKAGKKVIKPSWYDEYNRELKEKLEPKEKMTDEEIARVLEDAKDLFG